MKTKTLIQIHNELFQRKLLLQVEIDQIDRVLKALKPSQQPSSTPRTPHKGKAKGARTPKRLWPPETL